MTAKKTAPKTAAKKTKKTKAQAKAKAKAKAPRVAKAEPPPPAPEKPLAYNIGPKTVTVFFDGKAHTVEKTTYLAAALREKNWGEVKRLCSPARAIAGAGAASGLVAVTAAGVVTFKNRPLNNASAKRIVELMREGFPIESELRTLESLMRHDDPAVWEGFEDFIERWHVPRLETGQIVLVKGVRRTPNPNVFVSGHHTGGAKPFTYEVGKIAELPWSEVDRNPANTCSKGLHACPLSQVRRYYGDATRDAIIELHVWPEHFAALPTDYRTEGKVRLQQCFVARELPADAGENDLTGRA